MIIQVNTINLHDKNLSILTLLDKVDVVDDDVEVIDNNLLFFAVSIVSANCNIFGRFTNQLHICNWLVKFSN